MTDKTVSEALNKTYKYFAEEMKNPFYGVSTEIFSHDAFSMSPPSFKESNSIAGEVFELLMGAHFSEYKVKKSEKSLKYGLIDLFIFPVLLDMFLKFTNEYCFNNGDPTVADDSLAMDVCRAALALLFLLSILTRGLLSAALTLTLPFLPVLTLIHGQKLLAEIEYSHTEKGFVGFLDEIFLRLTGLHLDGGRKMEDRANSIDYNYISLLDSLLLFVPNVVDVLDILIPYDLATPLVVLCSAVKYVLGAALMLLFTPYVAVSYFALKDNMESPFGAFFPGHYRVMSSEVARGDYGVRSFFDFFTGVHETDWMYQKSEGASCGLLDLLVVPFMIDYVYKYFSAMSGNKKGGVAAFMAKVGLCVTTPLYVVNMAVRYALAAVLTAAVMVMKAAVMPVYGAAVALPYGASKCISFFKNEGFEKGVESGFSALTQVC